MEALFSGCPVLEVLHMRDCWLDSLRALDISISTLKNITIKSESATRYKFTINAPSLECLDYFDFLADGYTLKNMNSLSEAHIDVKPSYVNSFSHSQHVRDLVEGISNVGFLYLSAHTLQTLEIAKCCLPTFSNSDANKRSCFSSKPTSLMIHTED
ncbi:putative F-box protein At3g58860 [Malania oleifera]|uniref:putative F-box protein At3g58860 n=1 Tax=Malania oleifera TaxID=397392 RepID=UPI0025ADAC91|nr:putative F-box protein At3g58860 [Malania oleifera]